jgi:EAL domain-containing protein (putative c-di-GMP-specific phosphodiesterase class I)
VKWESYGRDWLAAMRAGRAGDGDAEKQIALAPVSSGELGAVGVLMAVKEADSTWSRAERALVAFAAEFYGPKLDDRATPLPAMPVHHPWRSGPDFETGMRDAVDKGELTLVFQPEVDLATSEVLAVEALLRWQHPKLGELSPESFINLAERSDLIKIVGAWVIDESVYALAAWNAELPGLDIQLRINVSPAQVTDDELVTLFGAVLAAHGVRGDQVCVEITENVPTKDLAVVSQTLRGLKAIGVSSAMDDVGSGYSTLSQLRQLPVDVIKVDRSLVSGLYADRRAQAIVTALIGLSLVLDIVLVAEGVEDEREVEALLRLGCSRAQGHYLGKPVGAPAILELLRERGRRSS